MRSHLALMRKCRLPGCRARKPVFFPSLGSAANFWFSSSRGRLALRFSGTHLQTRAGAKAQVL